MATRTIDRKTNRPRHYRPRPGDLVTMNGETYRVPTPQMLRDFADVEAGRLDGWETAETVDELFAACGVGK